MELLIQPESKGIRYDGYDNDFIQCVFEDANVAGRNERYEFRCRPDLECCGRVCCLPQEAAVPLWLMILFIILGLLLLSALLGTLAWLYRKNRKRKKDVGNVKPTRKVVPLKTAPHELEKIEVKPKNVVVPQKKPEKPKFVPSPMEVQHLTAPEAKRIIRHSGDEISRASLPEYFDPPEEQPQRAEIAYYRPFEPDPMDEMILSEPIQHTASYHSISDIVGLSRQPSIATVGFPEGKRAEIMFCRPGFICDQSRWLNVCVILRIIRKAKMLIGHHFDSDLSEIDRAFAGSCWCIPIIFHLFGTAMVFLHPETRTLAWIFFRRTFVLFLAAKFLIEQFVNNLMVEASHADVSRFADSVRSIQPTIVTATNGSEQSITEDENSALIKAVFKNANATIAHPSAIGSVPIVMIPNVGDPLRVSYRFFSSSWDEILIAVILLIVAMTLSAMGMFMVDRVQHGKDRAFQRYTDERKRSTKRKRKLKRVTAFFKRFAFYKSSSSSPSSSSASFIENRTLPAGVKTKASPVTSFTQDSERIISTTGQSTDSQSESSTGQTTEGRE